MDHKGRDLEEEYIKQAELARIRTRRAQISRQTAVDEREKLKQLHWMRCPKCGMGLDEVAFKGVSVDACFSCGGMFLDQGEIDKILKHREPGFLNRIFRTLTRPEKYGDT